MKKVFFYIWIIALIVMLPYLFLSFQSDVAKKEALLIAKEGNPIVDAVYLYKKNKKEFPEKISDLVPNYLVKAPPSYWQYENLVYTWTLTHTKDDSNLADMHYIWHENNASTENGWFFSSHRDHQEKLTTD